MSDHIVWTSNRSYFAKKCICGTAVLADVYVGMIRYIPLVGRTSVGHFEGTAWRAKLNNKLIDALAGVFIPKRRRDLFLRCSAANHEEYRKNSGQVFHSNRPFAN